MLNYPLALHSYRMPALCLRSTIIISNFIKMRENIKAQDNLRILLVCLSVCPHFILPELHILHSTSSQFLWRKYIMHMFHWSQGRSDLKWLKIGSSRVRRALKIMNVHTVQPNPPKLHDVSRYSWSRSKTCVSSRYEILNLNLSKC